jgi:AhpD family alkylhydroperoxidase
MRLAILDSGHSFGTKMLLALIKAISRQPVLDIIKLGEYRADFYGRPMQGMTHLVMRGPSAWSIADRELIAAFVSKTNNSEFCIKAHSEVAQRAYGGTKTVATLMSDPGMRDVEQPLRATLVMLGKLVREHTVAADDMRAVLAAGASRQHIVDALAVCFCFNVINRLADAFEFFVPGPDAFEAGAKYLLARGYR